MIEERDEVIELVRPDEKTSLALLQHELSSVTKTLISATSAASYSFVCLFDTVDRLTSLILFLPDLYAIIQLLYDAIRVLADLSGNNT